MSLSFTVSSTDKESQNNYYRFVYCRHYRGVANPQPCTKKLFPQVGAESTVHALGRAKGQGCILEFYSREKQVEACGACPFKIYSAEANKRIIRRYN